MVWRDSFPRGSYTFTENFRRYDFCPVYFVLPRLTAPGSPRMSLARETFQNMFQDSRKQEETGKALITNACPELNLEKL